MIRRGVTGYQWSTPTARRPVWRAFCVEPYKSRAADAFRQVQNGLSFFSPFFFFFLLLDMSLSLARVSSSAVADEDDPLWISLTCAGGGKVGSIPVSTGFSSLSGAAVGFNSLGSAAGGTAALPADFPKGEPPKELSVAGAVPGGGSGFTTSNPSAPFTGAADPPVISERT